MRVIPAAAALALGLMLASPVWSAEESAFAAGSEAASAPAGPGDSVTTQDVRIPVEQLEVLVRPLTREELEPELAAWFALVREKAGAIAAAKRSIQKTDEARAEAEADPGAAREAMREAEQAEEEASRGRTDPEAGKAPPAETSGASEAAVVSEAEARKETALEELAALQAEQTDLITRLRVVLDSYAEKGGEVEREQQYVAALQKVEVDPSGLEATWAAVKGWLVSEQGGVAWAKRTAVFLAILSATWLVARGATGLTRRALERSRRLSMLAKSLVERSVHNVVLGLGLLVAVASLGVAMTPLLAALGAAGFIVGFALQGTLSNFASGLMILVYKPFDVGDVVEAGGVTGKVDQMSLVSTTFTSFDNQEIIVPNNAIWGSVITNVTARDKRRVDMSFGVAYDADLGRVEQILTETVAKHERVLEDPAPVVKVHELADSAVVFICRPWCRTEDYWDVFWDVTRTVKARLDEEGISIPFPQREIHIRHEDGATA